MFLLDTNVISELRRTNPNPAVVTWIQKIPSSQLYIAAITAGEIQAGIERTREQDTAKAREIEVWLDQMTTAVSTLDATPDIFRIWAKILHKKQDHLIEDGLIAATAIHHNLIVTTRNIRDFAHFPVKTVNLFEE